MISSARLCAARPYSVSELLQLQKSLPVVTCSVNQISKHPNIASIFQLPGEALSHPERFKIETEKLADLIKSTKRSQSSRRQLLHSSEDSEYSTRSERHQARWTLRQRESSDRSSQPHSAPSGLIAQQSENFRRFYRAVASPTHVRVTAGGRIVPNTRVVAPLPYEWNVEKLCFEPRQPLQGDPGNFRGISWSQYPPLSAGFPQVIPGGLITPYNARQQLNNIVLQPATQEAPASFSSSEQKSFEDERASKMRDALNAPIPIQISPPTQFDHSKPFMYNGQFMYPVPQGFHPPLNKLPVPITMLGNPNFLPGAPSLPTGFFPHQFPMSMGNIPGPFVFPPGQFPIPGLQSAYSGTEFVSSSPCLPLPGLIQISDFTRSQIQGLNNRLSFINSQIANNTHQLDKTYLLSQRETIQAQIETLEGILQVHEAVERNERKTLSKDAIEYTGPMSSSTTDGEIQANQENPLSTPSAVPGLLTPLVPVEPCQTPQKRRDDEPQALSMPTVETTQVESRSKSRLSAAAAMAPPFQPRSLAAAMQPDNFTGLASAPSAEPASHRVQVQTESRTSLNISSNRRQGSLTPKLHPSLERAHSLHDPAAQGLPEILPATFQRSNTFHGQTTTSTVPDTTMIDSPQSLPYLVGTLPNGVTETNASAQDLVYSRPLTNEEVRARYLYFGKAPRSIQSGLPKFDGKDFYPPSPVKEHAKTVVAGQPSVNRRNPRPCVLDFENLFTEPGAPGYKPPSPARSNAVRVSAQPQPESLVRYNSRPQDVDKSHVPSIYSDGQLCDVRHSRLPSQPATPPMTVLNHEGKGEEDYSMLFMERGVPGYKSPSPCPAISVPVTPNASGLHVSRQPGDNSWVAEGTEGASPVRDGTSSDTSTIEIQLTKQKKSFQKRYEKVIGPPFAERVANFNSEQQTLFLQNMLRNTATMSGPAPSGTISATAQGYLPQYRGSAAASLSPVMLDATAVERDMAQSAAHIGAFEDINTGNASKRFMTLLAENRPLSRAIPIIRPANEGLDAEAYVRQLQQRAEKDVTSHGWNLNTTGTGPVRGSDW